MYIQFKQILIFFILLINSFALSQECIDTNPTQYGTCEISLGFVWTGNNCVLVYGCDVGEDEGLFYDTYEECDLECNFTPSLGDINNDGSVDILDAIEVVNLVLNDEYNQIVDMNYDGVVNVLDIIDIIYIILN